MPLREDLTTLAGNVRAREGVHAGELIVFISCTLLERDCGFLPCNRVVPELPHSRHLKFALNTPLIRNVDDTDHAGVLYLSLNWSLELHLKAEMSAG